MGPSSVRERHHLDDDVHLLSVQKKMSKFRSPHPTGETRGQVQLGVGVSFFPFFMGSPGTIFLSSIGMVPFMTFPAFVSQ